MLCGLLFKIAAAPFHLWVLDVYEGSPTIILIFAVLTKISIIVVINKNLLLLFLYSFCKRLVSIH